MSGCQILRVRQVDAVESSSARFPPPAALEHWGAVEAGSVVVPFFKIFLNRIYTFSISRLVFLRPMRRAIRESCFYFLFIFIFTDCTWRRDSSWSRTKDRWASLRRCPYIRQSPICTVPVPNTIWNLNIRRICDKKMKSFYCCLKRRKEKRFGRILSCRHKLLLLSPTRMGHPMRGLWLVSIVVCLEWINILTSWLSVVVDEWKSAIFNQPSFFLFFRPFSFVCR